MAIIADNLHEAGFSLGWNCKGDTRVRTEFDVEKLTAFLEVTSNPDINVGRSPTFFPFDITLEFFAALDRAKSRWASHQELHLTRFTQGNRELKARSHKRN